MNGKSSGSADLEKGGVEDKRLAALQTRNATLQAALRSVQAQRLALLHAQPTSLGPDTKVNIVTPPYNPSTSSHSTPSNIPVLPDPVIEEILAEARTILNRHIKALHDYNGIKDVAQGLLGMIAEARGVRVRDLYGNGEFGVDEAD